MKRIFAANWKMFKGPKETRTFFEEWRKSAIGILDSVQFFVPALNASVASEALLDSDFAWGLQNFYPEIEGAYTGENSLAVAKSLGARLALVGHSERRHVLGEKDEFLNRKIKFACHQDIQVTFCIGEQLPEREAKQTVQVITQQLDAGLDGIEATAKIQIAYEPVWAIGTGKTATPEMVMQAHQEVRKWLNGRGYDFPILYGGSVKPENAKELLAVPAVDGFLVGGASLQIDSFLKICSAMSH